MEQKHAWSLPEDLVERYLIFGAIAAIALMTVATIWEINFAGNESAKIMVRNIVDWTGPVMSTTAFIILVLEANAMIMKRRYLDRGRQEGRQTNQKEWEEWLKRKEKAEAEGQVFTEPHPRAD